MPKVITISDKNWKKLKYITFGLSYAIFGFWFLINGESVLGYWNESWTWQILIYILGVAVFLAVLEKLPDEIKDTKREGKSFQDNIRGFLISFPLFSVIFILFRDSGIWFQNLSTLPVYMVVSHIIFQTGIVATSEEIIFRGVIFTSFSKVHRIIGYLGSSFIFAVFHYNAYGGSINLMIVAFLLGLVLAFLVHMKNLGYAIGFHSAYNCFVIGATYLMIIS